MKKTVFSLFLAANLLVTCFIPVTANTAAAESPAGSNAEITAGTAVPDAAATTVSEEEITELQSLDIEEDPLSTLVIGLTNEYPDIYSGVYYSDATDKYHIVSIDPERVKRFIASNSDLRKAYSEIKDHIIFDRAEFSYAELDTASSQIMECMKNASGTVCVSLDDQANTLIVETSQPLTKELKSQILRAVDKKSKVNEVSLADRIVFVYREFEIQETATAVKAGSATSDAPEIPPSSDPEVPALHLTRDQVEQFYILDAKKQAYTGVSFYAYGSNLLGGGGGYLFNSSEELFAYIINMINGLSNVRATEITAPVREGDMLVFLKDGTRYSYKFEKENILNINGICYEVDRQAIDTVKKSCLFLEKDGFFSLQPKWLSWMNVRSITSITSYTAKNGITAVNKGAIAAHANILYRTIDITDGETYPVGDLGLPDGPGTFKVVLTFKSGVKYVLIAKGSTLYVESSDQRYGCKYKMKYDTAEDLNDQFDMCAFRLAAKAA